MQSKDHDEKEKQTPAKKSRRRFIIFAVVVLLIVIAGLFYWHSTFSEDTDDAQVDGNLFQVSSRITGQITKVYVDDNVKVEAGQPIAEIDPRDQMVALEQAQAALASAEATANQADDERARSPSVSTNTTDQHEWSGCAERGGRRLAGRQAGAGGGGAGGLRRRRMQSSRSWMLIATRRWCRRT